MTTLSNGRSFAVPEEIDCMYLSAFKASSPRTAYSTSRTAGLILDADKAFCLEFEFVDDIANDLDVGLLLVILL